MVMAAAPLTAADGEEPGHMFVLHDDSGLVAAMPGTSAIRRIGTRPIQRISGLLVHRNLASMARPYRARRVRARPLSRIPERRYHRGNCGNNPGNFSWKHQAAP